MDNIVGSACFSGDGRRPQLSIKSVLIALSDRWVSKTPLFSVNHDDVSLVAFANAYSPDSSHIWLDNQTLVYVQGNVTLIDSANQIVINAPDEERLRSFAWLLLDIYKRHGIDSFRNLSGSFVVVIYQVQLKEITIATDRLGSRPVFCHVANRTVRFATDIRPILAMTEISRELDERSVVEFLRFSMIFGDRTLYRDISTVPPASALTISENGVRLQSYWSMAFDNYERKSIQSYSVVLAEAFKSGVDRLIGNSKSDALMLSGGLDSRIVAAAAASSGHRLNAISFGEFRNDEVGLAERVANDLGWNHEMLYREPDYYTSIMPEAVQISNGAYSFVHAHYLNLHESLHALEVGAVLEGWGLDLLFSGTYLPKRKIRLPGGRTVKVLSLAPMSETPIDIAEHILGDLGFATDALFARLADSSLQTMWHEWPRQSIYERVAASQDRADNAYDRLDLFAVEMFNRFRSYLFPMSMRYGSRQRNPVFDNEILELFLRLPPELRFNSKVYRKSLEILSPQLSRIPYSRTGASLTAPAFVENIFWLTMPFVRARRLQARRLLNRYANFPAAQFDSYPNPGSLIRSTTLKDEASRWLLQGRYLELGIVNPQVVGEMYDRHTSGSHDYSWHLLTLLSIAVWLEEWS